MRRILLLIPSTTYHAADFLAAAERLGVEVLVGTDRRQTLEDATRDRVLHLDFLDPEAAAREIARVARRRKIDAVIPTDDDTAVLAAVASTALGLPSNPPGAACAARDKHRFRRALQEAGLPGPAWRVVPVAEDPEAVAREVGYPCVLKPTFLSASRGVIRADDASGFLSAFRRIAALLRTKDVAARGGEAARHLLVESYLDGPEVSLEGLLRGGRLELLALFDKPDPMEGPTFEETIYVTPSRLTSAEAERVRTAVQSGARALGLLEGPVHAELRLVAAGGSGGREPVLVELAARSIGGLCSRALRFGTGLTLEEVILRHALEADLEAPAREGRAAGVLMLPIPSRGKLREVRGMDDARAVPGVTELDLTVPGGHEVIPLPEGDRYLGFVFARGDSPAAVEAALREAWRRLEVVIDSEVAEEAISACASPPGS